MIQPIPGEVAGACKRSVTPNLCSSTTILFFVSYDSVINEKVSGQPFFLRDISRGI